MTFPLHHAAFGKRGEGMWHYFLKIGTDAVKRIRGDVPGLKISNFV
jgi:hypothetical protein